MQKLVMPLGVGLLMLISAIALRYFRLMPEVNGVAYYLTMGVIAGLSTWVTQIATSAFSRKGDQ